jgi:hypothetical protein
VGQTDVQVSLSEGHSINVDITHAAIEMRRATLVPGRMVHITASIDPKGMAHAAQISPLFHSEATLPSNR